MLEDFPKTAGSSRFTRVTEKTLVVRATSTTSWIILCWIIKLLRVDFFRTGICKVEGRLALLKRYFPCVQVYEVPFRTLYRCIWSSATKHDTS